MEKNLHDHLIRNTEELRDLLRRFSTESIAGMCSSFYLGRLILGSEEQKLVSPGRQPTFLLGLMLSTNEPEKPNQFGKEEWEKAERLLNEIFTSYAWMFWPKPEEIDSLTESWKQVREVAMPAFLHYFNTGLLASVEQIRDRIKRYLCPFNDEIKAHFNFSASEALEIADYVSGNLQASFDNVVRCTIEEKKARLAFLDQAEREGWDIHRMREEAKSSSYLPSFKRLMEATTHLSRTRLVHIEEAFGKNLSESYWQNFVACRGEFPGFTYLTEQNLAEEKPLFKVAAGEAICPLSNNLFLAILMKFESQLSEGDNREAFFRRRDKALENDVEDKIRPIFHDSAKFYSSIFESPDLQNEHDLLVLWENILLVIEAKASPPIEPFRDPDKAFTRISRAFHSDRGIQKAYEQADRIRRQIESGESVDLYNINKELVLTLNRDLIKDVYCICVTRDDYGALSVDLSLLLEKEPNGPFPWAVNILDLESLIDAWRYFGWGPDKLVEYLDGRSQLHGKVFTVDELEIAGFFIKHGGLHWILNARADRFFLTPDYSNVFDQIYQSRHGGEPVVYNPTEPFLGDMREMLADMFNEDAQKQKAKGDTVQKRQKVGHNEPCPCGSGKKFKRCCGN